MGHGGTSPWTRWTLPRGLVAGLWMAAAWTAGGFFAWLAVLDLATFYGEPPTAADFRTASIRMLAATALLTAGPAGIWFMRRRGAWLAFALVIAILGLVLSITYWFGSPNLPTP